MSRISTAALRDLAREIVAPVLAAGALEMAHYKGGFQVFAKADDSPVTAADRDAEAVLLDALARIAPGIPVVAEESASEGRVPVIGERFFLVDPLDGTKEFINKRGEFTVNVALVESGTPVLGVVMAPALGQIYATFGLDDAQVATFPVDAPPSNLDGCAFRSIRTRQPDPARLVAVASRSHSTPETEAFLARYAIAERRDVGSSLKFCTLARGEADIYPRLGPTMEWDVAAGHAVLTAAGGAVTDPDGGPLAYGKAETGYLNGHFVAWGAKTPFPARR